MLGGEFTIFEVAAVEEGGAAAAAGVQPLDILLVVAGKSVRGASPEYLVKCLESAEDGQLWRVMRVPVPTAVTHAGQRMKAVLRAYQECAATLVQSAACVTRSTFRYRQGRTRTATCMVW